MRSEDIYRMKGVLAIEGCVTKPLNASPPSRGVDGHNCRLPKAFDYVSTVITVVDDRSTT
eukprot:5497653-Pyramimonas_sp.AAC.1